MPTSLVWRFPGRGARRQRAGPERPRLRCGGLPPQSHGTQTRRRPYSRRPAAPLIGRQLAPTGRGLPRASAVGRLGPAESRSTVRCWGDRRRHEHPLRLGGRPLIASPGHQVHIWLRSTTQADATYTRSRDRSREATSTCETRLEPVKRHKGDSNGSTRPR